MIMTVDIGTTIFKAGLFSLQGELLFSFRRPLRPVAGRGPLEYESDPREWGSALGEAAASFRRRCSGGFRPQALVISGNGPTLTAVDRRGQPLRPALSWMDRRSHEESRRIRDRCGLRIDPSFYLPKALWMKRNEPELYSRCAAFLSCPEYLVFRLTGRALTVLPGDHFLKWYWTPEIVEALELEPALFPPFVSPGERAGTVTAAAADIWGLPAGTPVITGGADFVSALLGAGAVKPGRGCDRAGTSEGVNLCCRRLIDDSRLMGYGHVVKPYFNLSGIISTSGRALEWAGAVWGGPSLSIDELSAAASQAAPGSGKLLFLPYLTGERAPLWDPHARGSFIGLSLRHGRNEMIRAVFEGVAYAIRHVIETMGEHHLVMEDLRVIGAPAQNSFWNQIKADVTGIPVLVPCETEAELFGNLCLALAGLGRYRGPGEASDAVVQVGQVFRPDESRKGRYDRLYGLYRDSYGGLKGVFHRLGEEPGGPQAPSG